MENTGGWIKLHRCILSKAIWKCSTPEQRNILIVILLLANHEANQWLWKGEKYTCQPGEFITSSNKLAETVGCSRQQVRAALDKFEKLEFLTHEATNKSTKISVINWELYQNCNALTNQQTNQEPTKSQPTTNQQQTTNKNERIKECKNVRSKELFIPPTEQEVAAYILHNGCIHVSADEFISFYQSKNWLVGKSKMKDWQAALRGWEARAKKAAQQRGQSFKKVQQDPVQNAKGWAEFAMQQQELESLNVINADEFDDPLTAPFLPEGSE